MVEPECLIDEGRKPYQIIRITVTLEEIAALGDWRRPNGLRDSLTQLFNQRGRIDHLAEHVEKIVERIDEDYDKMEVVLTQEVHLK